MEKREINQYTRFPRYKDMIRAALCALHQKNGSSRQAILKYMSKNNDIKDRYSTNRHLKMALKSGIRNGELKQTKGRGANGSFKLVISRGLSKKTNVDKVARNNQINPKQSSIKKNTMTQCHTRKRYVTKRTKVTKSSTKINNASNSTKHKVAQSFTKKRNPTKSSTHKTHATQSSTKINNIKIQSTKKINSTISKITGKIRQSNTSADTHGTNSLAVAETETNVASIMNGPDAEGRNINFSKWSNVKLYLRDSFSVRTPDDESKVDITSLDTFKDGKIIVADVNNRCIKLFDDKGNHLYTLKPRHLPNVLTVGSNQEILVSTFPFYDHIIQVFDVKDDVISLKENIETTFRIVGLAAFDDRIIATVYEADHLENQICKAKLFNRDGKVYWSTPLEAFNRHPSKIICVQERGEIFCIVQNYCETLMAKLNARTGELIRESLDCVDGGTNDAANIFYCITKDNYEGYVHVSSSDFIHDKILASTEDVLGEWPQFVEYDESRGRFLIAYDGHSDRNDCIDIFNVFDTSSRMRYIYRSVGKLNNVKRHVMDAVSRVFSPYMAISLLNIPVD